jgi:hypothetical protein
MGHLIQRSKRIILILGGVAALAGGPAVSIAAAATNNGGGSGYDCANGKTWFDQRVKDYNADVAAGNTAAAGDAKRDAQAEKDRAQAAGCDTSTWTVPTIIIGTRFYLPITAVGTQFTTS